MFRYVKNTKFFYVKFYLLVITPCCVYIYIYISNLENCEFFYIDFLSKLTNFYFIKFMFLVIIFWKIKKMTKKD